MDRLISKIIDISKPCEKADFLPNILGEQYPETVNGRIRVVLFGAGSAGRHLSRALKIHGVNVCCFCDNNPRLTGAQCIGYPVISVDELKQDHRESLIVISASRPYAQEIKDQLLGSGFSPDRIHTPLPEHVLYYTNVDNLYWPPDEVKACARQLQEAYDIFFDRKSRDIFIHRMALLINGFDYESFQRFIRNFADLLNDPDSDLFSKPRYDENHFYFHSEFFPLRTHEVFANVGALVGDCAVEFVHACQAKGLEYEEIINFEPDPDNCAKLSENMHQFPRVRCLPYGLWSQRSRLRFSNPNQTGAGTPGSLDNDGPMEVDVVSLDGLLPDTQITFMKMDVEGAEMEALRGAAGTIRRNRPKLAVSVYHKRNDIFEIPLFIHQLHPGYRFYLRHHSTTFNETVLYAVP